MPNREPTRVEILKARITYTATGFPASRRDVEDCYGGRVNPAPEDGWWWIGATPQSAERIRRNGMTAVGELTTTIIPPQSAPEVAAA